MPEAVPESALLPPVEEFQIQEEDIDARLAEEPEFRPFGRLFDQTRDNGGIETSGACDAGDLESRCGGRDVRIEAAR